MKILIDRIGPWSDKGMAAITLAMADALKNRFPDASIAFSGPIPQEIDLTKYSQYGIELRKGMFPLLHSITHRLNPCKIKPLKAIVLGTMLLTAMFRYSMWLLLYKLAKLDIRLLVKDASDVIKEYKEADWIIFSGGQRIMNISPGLISVLYEIVFSKLLSKPVMLYAQSCGPFEPKYARWLINLVLNRVDLITTREEESTIWLKDKVSIKSPVFTTADAAFGLPTLPKEAAIALLRQNVNSSEGKTLVGITVVKNFPDYKNPDSTFEKYANAMAEAIDYIINKLDAHVILFPQVIYVPGKDDRVASGELLEKITHKSQVTMLTDDYAPEQLKAMYGCMDLFIGTRFHSCILAQSMSVPTIPIEYHGHKGRGIMKMLGLEQYVQDIRTITAPDLIAAVDRIWADREGVRAVLTEKIGIMQRENDRNLKLAVEYLGLPENS